jgi:hypothetical protein
MNIDFKMVFESIEIEDKEKGEGSLSIFILDSGMGRNSL